MHGSRATRWVHDIVILFCTVQRVSVGQVGMGGRCMLLRDDDAGCLRCCRDRRTDRHRQTTQTQCIRRTVVGQGRRMRCYKPAPCSLSSCTQNRYLPPRCSIAAGDVSVGSGRGVVSLVRRAEFWGLVVVVVVCVGGVGGVSCGRCWAALFHGSQRCMAAATLALSGPIPCIIVSHHHPKTAHSRVGTAVSVVPCLQGLSRLSHLAGLACLTAARVRALELLASSPASP